MHCRFVVGVGATVSYWADEQVVRAIQIRLVVGVAAKASYSVILHTVRAAHVRSD